MKSTDDYRPVTTVYGTIAPTVAGALGNAHQYSGASAGVLLGPAPSVLVKGHQANVALLVRVSVKYLGFLTGMLMSLVGAVFVLGRLTEAPAEFSAEGPFGKFTLATVSPGIILAALGTILMVTTVMVNPPTDVTDGNVYLRSGTVADTSAGRRQ